MCVCAAKDGSLVVPIEYGPWPLGRLPTFCRRFHVVGPARGQVTVMAVFTRTRCVCVYVCECACMRSSCMPCVCMCSLCMPVSGCVHVRMRYCWHPKLAKRSETERERDLEQFNSVCIVNSVILATIGQICNWILSVGGAYTLSCFLLTWDILKAVMFSYTEEENKRNSLTL